MSGSLPEEAHEIDLIAASLEDRLDERERQRLDDHLIVCAECRTVLSALARAAADGTLLLPPVQSGPTGLPPILRAWLPIAALLVLSTAAGVLWLASGEPAAPRPPGPAVVQARPEPQPAPPPMEAQSSADSSPSRTRSQPARPPSPEVIHEGLLARRGGGERTLAGKTFRLAAGEWIDTAYDPIDLLPVITVSSPGDRQRLLGRLPGLEPYASLGDRVIVVFDRTVYRFRPPDPS